MKSEVPFVMHPNTKKLLEEKGQMEWFKRECKFMGFTKIVIVGRIFGPTLEEIELFEEEE